MSKWAICALRAMVCTPLFRARPCRSNSETLTYEESFMEDSACALLLRIFRDMPDQRMAGKVAHKLHDILVITVCAIISGLEHWTQIEDFALANETWFRSFLELPNGIPSHDKLHDLFAGCTPKINLGAFALQKLNSTCRAAVK